VPLARDRGLTLPIKPEPSLLTSRPILCHLTGDKPRQTTNLLPDTALVTKAMLPDGGGHEAALGPTRGPWPAVGGRGRTLVLGSLWTPRILGLGSPHTSLAWMCALGFGDPPMEEGGSARAPPTSAPPRRGAER